MLGEDGASDDDAEQPSSGERIVRRGGEQIVMEQMLGHAIDGVEDKKGCGDQGKDDQPGLGPSAVGGGVSAGSHVFVRNRVAGARNI